MFSKINMLKIILFCFSFFTNKISAQVLVNEEEKEIHEGEGAQKYWEKLEEAIQEKNELNGIDIKNRGAFRINEFFQQRQTQQRSGLSNSGQWSQVVQANSNQQGGGMGRVEDVAFDPSNSNIFYVATAGGGLWKTNNDGASFFCVTSGLPVTGISSVVVDYSNTNIIYIFTGSAQGNTSAGVFKSTNAGITWAPTSLQDSINGAEKMISYDLKMHPLIPAMLFAGTNKGLFRTIDGGITWNKVLERQTFDVEFKPGNSNIIYAASLQNVSTSPIYGDTATWKTSQSLFTFMYPTAAVVSGYQQIRIAVSNADPNAVWACASIENINDSVYAADGGSFSMRYAFDANTNSLTIQQMPTKIQSCFERMLRSGYGRDYSDIYVSATGYIFIMGLEAMSSLTTAGTSWVLKSKQCAAGTRWMHVDAGKIKFNNGFVYACTDGGLFRQAENYTSANLPWTDLTAGLEITQSYVHAATPQDAEMYMYANQDNGTHVRTSASTYNNFVGGDGTACEINPTDKTIFYGSVQNGEFLRRSDGVTITPGAGCNCKDTAGYSGSFVFGRAFMQQPFNYNYLLAAKRRLYVSSNKGTSWTNKVITGSVYTHYIARVSTTNSSNTIYVVEDETIRFLRSTNYGNSWTDLTAQKPYNGVISDIAISPTNDLDIYMSFYGNDPNAKVFRSINGGASWTNISNELPNVDTRTIALTGTANGIYVGNDFGVYYRDDNTNGWISFSNNLPIVFVMNLVYDATNAKISAATFGRGIWVSDAYNIADCPVNRTLNSIYFNRNTYSASAAISSTGTIYQDYNSRVTFSAENITLSPGFSASQNSNFIATPYGCLPNPVLLRANNIPQNIPLEKDTDGNITNFNAIENK
jgi:hypothetical protein